MSTVLPFIFRRFLDHSSKGMHAGREHPWFEPRRAWDMHEMLSEKNYCNGLPMPKVVWITQTYIKQCVFVCTMFVHNSQVY